MQTCPLDALSLTVVVSDSILINRIKNIVKSGGHKNPPQKPVINMEQESKGDNLKNVKYDAKTWADSYVPLRKEVSVSSEMCTWVDEPKVNAEVNVSVTFYLKLKFNIIYISAIFFNFL